MKEIVTFMVVMLPLVTLFFGVKAKERKKLKGWSVLVGLLVIVTITVVMVVYKEAHWVSYILITMLGMVGFLHGVLFTENETR